MYFECRHIMPNGARCHSPALRDKDYCYYHTRLHQRAKSSAPSGARPAKSSPEDPLKLPVIEDRSAIQVALAQIFDGLSSGKIDRPTAAIYLAGLRIASQAVERKQDILPFKSVESVTRSRDGQELAPKLRVCDPPDDCPSCDDRETCKDYEPAEDSAES